MLAKVFLNKSLANIKKHLLLPLLVLSSLLIIALTVYQEQHFLCKALVLIAGE